MPIKSLTKQETLPPQSEMPEVYKELQTLKLEEKQTDFKMPEKVNKEVNVPPKMLFDYNLKHLKSFKNIRRKYKLKNLKNIFLSDLSIVLKEYPPDDENNELNDELLIEILNITEDYFFYPLNKVERENVKKDVVLELMLPYFRNDPKLLEKTIGHVYHKVKKSSFRKRLWQRFKYFFLRGGGK